MNKFLSNLWQKIKLFFNGIPAHLKAAVHIGVAVTENIKLFVDSPVTDIITALIPGDVDDKVKNLIRTALPGILIQLKLADKCANENDPQKTTTCAIKIIQELKGDIKNAFLHNLSILISQVAADGKLTWKDGAYIMEWYYQQHFKAQ